MERYKAFQTLELLVLVLALAFVVLGTYGQRLGDTANSRLASVYALTEFGTWYIDRPVSEDPIRFEQRTIDKVVVPTDDGPRMLSSKPPMLPLLMTIEYLVLNRMLGLDLNDTEDTDAIVGFMSFTFAGLGFLLALVFAAKTLRLFVADDMSRFIALLGLAFGTQLWGFSHNFNNHVPAAGLLVVAVYYAAGLGTGRLDPTAWRFFLFGLTGALVVTIDMPAGVFVAIAGFFLLYKLPAQTLKWTVAGAAAPLIAHFYIMYTATGSFLPVQVRGDLYLYESSYWRNPRGIDALNEPKPVYLFHMILGRTGLFLLYPITVLGILAGLRALRDRSAEINRLLLAGLAGFAVLTLYYALRTNNYGGEAYGFRWYIVAMPILMLMGAPLLAETRRRWQWLVVLILMSISFYSAWECTTTPWASNREWTVQFFGRSY